MGSERKPILAVTMGDPCGIGPEVVLRALASPRARRAARFVVYGSRAVLERVAEAFGLPLPRFRLFDGESGGPWLVDEASCPASLALKGRATAAGGRASVAWILAATDAALTGRVDGIVTGPISKTAMHMARYEWPGHTELIAERTGAKRPVMTMVGGGIRAALVTTHVAVGDLPKAITRQGVLDTIRVVNEDLRRYFGLPRPRLDICALNPHASEGGRFGRTEREAILPAIRRARREGILCDGPTPADVAFTKERLAAHDAIVAMYHDQACIPVKMIAFDRGVNVTLGLPIVRASPDHGTAYDIAAQGVADPGSMIEAILLAAHIARCRLGGGRSGMRDPSGRRSPETRGPVGTLTRSAPTARRRGR